MGYDSRDYYRPSGMGGFSMFPPVLKKIIIANVVVFFIQMIFDNLTFGGTPGWYVLNRYFALNPISGIDQAGQAFNFQIWQLFTFQFMHGGFGHIFFNMLMLWMFGMEIENIMGSQKFLIFYLAAGVGGGLVQAFISPLFVGGGAPTIGASAGVFGVMLAFAMYFPDRPIYLYFLFPIKAKYLIGFMVIIEFFSVGNQTMVAHLAHVGGIITAFAFIMLDRKQKINVNSWVNSFKNLFSGKNKNPYSSFKNSTSRFSKPKNNDIQEAKFFDINEETKGNKKPTQEEIDRILDKISQSGYQNLTAAEKKILFEASKND